MVQVLLHSRRSREQARLRSSLFSQQQKKIAPRLLLAAARRMRQYPHHGLEADPTLKAEEHGRDAHATGAEQAAEISVGCRDGRTIAGEARWARAQ
jgi:hypothetical protein